VVSELNADAGTGVDSGVVFGQAYFYRILGLADDAEGEYSDIASATVSIPPPTNLSAEVLNDQAVKLTWNEPGATQAGRGEASGPQGKKRIEIEKKHKSQGPIAGEDLENDGLKRTAEEITNDKLNKKRQAGKGSAKLEMPDTPAYGQKPGGPINAQRDLGRTFAGESFIDGYVIERADGNGSFSIIDSVPNTDQYNDSGLLYGQTYKYRVCAYAGQYKSDYVTVDSVVTTFPTPTNLSATAISDQTITLSWSDNCSFEDGYELWKKVGDGSYEIIDSTDVNGTAYADSGLTYGESYSYKVRAFTTLNRSYYSNEEPIELIILPPSYLTLTALNDQVMQLSWSDNCNFEAGQELWRQIGAGSFAFLDSLNTDITTYNDSSLTYGEFYSYKLRSFTDQNVSAFSDSISGFTVFPAPSNLSADVLNDHQVELTWNDNCGFEDGYEIQQLEGSGAWEIIDSVQANGSTNTISGLTYGVSYKFKVKAFSDINSSAFSDSVTVSTVFPAPSNLSILQSGADAVLSWSDNCTFESGYVIERSDDGGDTFTVIDTLEANSVDYTDATIIMYVDNLYRVNAFTEYNNSGYSEEVEFSLFTGNIIYVTPTGSDFTGDGSVAYPYKTVQKAIDISTEGDMLLVADGTYNESINYSGKGITVASYFAVDEDTSHISTTIISAVSGRVVSIDDDDAVLKGLTITNGSGSDGSGVCVTNSPLITDCVITENSKNSNSPYGGGIYINSSSSSSSPEITNCTISNNEVYSFTSYDYSYGGGVYCGDNSTVTFTNCRILNNTAQIGQKYSAKGGGIYCGYGSNITLDNCVVSGNIGRGTSGNNSYPSEAYGAGIYSDGNILTITESDISNNILEATNTGAYRAFGAGIYCSASLTIDNSTINNNYFEGDDYWSTKLGGGIYTTVSSFTMTDCTIDGNEYEGFYSSSSNASFTNCTINNNGSYGIYSGTSSTFEQCTITNNGGTGIYAGSSSTFNLCSSSGNTVYGFYVVESGFFTNCIANNNTIGGYYIGSYSSELINCLAVDNDSTGMYLNNSSTLIRNCAISGNGTGVYAGGNSGPAFMNVILYDNTSELEGDSDATMSFDYSDVQDGSIYGAWANGTGNIDSDPVFVGGGDYHLQNGSPCIDAGNPSGTYNDADGSRNDMGAYGGPNGDR
jgi:hypothetical protein